MYEAFIFSFSFIQRFPGFKRSKTLHIASHFYKFLVKYIDRHVNKLLNANRESYILHQIVSFVITFEFHFSHTLSKNLVKCQFAVDEDVTSNLADRETFAILTNYKPRDTCKVFSDS